MTKTLALERDTANDIIVTPPEPVEYTYTFPTGKQVHVEVSGNGYTTLSANVTLNENRTVTADLINGTITGGDVIHPDTCTLIVSEDAYITKIYNLDEDPNMDNGTSVNGSNVNVGTYPYGTTIGIDVDYEKPMKSWGGQIFVNNVLVVDTADFNSYTHDYTAFYSFVITEDTTILVQNNSSATPIK